jgi:hypothetical protein
MSTTTKKSAPKKDAPKKAAAKPDPEPKLTRRGRMRKRQAEEAK